MLPSWLISIITFPGIVSHEFGHSFFCKAFGVRVHKTCYFRLGNPAGYVIHDSPDNFTQAFFIDIGPLIVSNILAIIAFATASSYLIGKQNRGWVFVWIGISLAIHSFPSNADAKALWNATKKHSKKNVFLMLIGIPFVSAIYMANLLRFFRLDIIWAIFLFGAVYLTIR